jgi:hypothetical protein
MLLGAQQPHAKASMLQLTTSVAQAQPTTPCAGRPAPPKVNQIDKRQS